MMMVTSLATASSLHQYSRLIRNAAVRDTFICARYKVSCRGDDCADKPWRQKVPRSLQIIIERSIESSSSAQFQRRSFSTSSPSSLKRLIQPFVLKCHPDMAKQQGLPKTGQQVNLKAIQNLNFYIDGAVQFMKHPSKKYPFDTHSTKPLIEIEFVMTFNRNTGYAMETTTSVSSGQPVTTSRRKVELQVPPPNFTPSQVERHVQHQIVKLLKIADLPVPASLPSSIQEDDEVHANQDSSSHQQSQHRRPLTPWEASRQRFWSRVQWKKFDAMYQQAMQDAQAHMMTCHKIRNTPRLRQALLAKILSNIQFTEEVLPLERLVAYRRLLRLLDEEFDALHLEDFGTFWEDQTTWIVTEARPYNTSSSAMRKRRQRHMETGYSFTIHHDNTVTMMVPIDFANDELVQELRRNIIDFVEWTSNSGGDGNASQMGGMQGIYEALMRE